MVKISWKYKLSTTKKMKRTYTVTLRLEANQYSLFTTALKSVGRRYVRLFNTTFRENYFFVERCILAHDRSRAVYLAIQCYWQHLGKILGSPRQILTVDDPYNEVVYTPDFSCNDRKNNYLPAEVHLRVIAESRGVLCEGVRQGTSHHPACSLARVKRRRKLPYAIKPHLYTDANGTLFYSIVALPQISHQGTIVCVRKVKLVRLEAREIREARVEITVRGFLQAHLAVSLRHMRTRLRA